MKNGQEPQQLNQKPMKDSKAIGGHFPGIAVGL